jgi:hypothetical protein
MLREVARGEVRKRTTLSCAGTREAREVEEVMRD